MKSYKAVAAIYEFDEPNSEMAPIDLVNVDDETDRHMASDEDFVIGEIVTEDQIEFKNAPYVTEQGVFNGPFAFKK